MEPADELWECLSRVRSLRFVSRTDGKTGWSGTGAGSVIVQSPADAVVIFTESGSWQPDIGRETHFSNVFRWSLLGPQLVRLEHLRFGSENPVHLFELAPRIDKVWLSVSPHLCREDCYSAELRLQEGGMLLRWAIAGPKKQENIEYQYRWSEKSC